MLVLGLGTACSSAAPSARAHRDDLAEALRSFLASHGQLCLAKSNWPISVTMQDVQARSNDALQMPVLERLGLVQGVPDEKANARSYQLTPLGKQYYLERPGRVPPDGAGVARDFCAGTVALDHIVRVEHDDGQGPSQLATVHYAYHFAAFPWMRDAEAQRVFPLVARLEAQQGARTLVQRFAWRAEGWVPLDVEN
jgi:hypothetical protein